MFGPCKWSACPSRVRTVVWTRCWERIPFSRTVLGATLSMAYARYNHISLWLYSRSPQGGPPDGLSPDLTVQGAHIWEYLLWIMLKGRPRFRRRYLVSNLHVVLETRRIHEYTELGWKSVCTEFPRTRLCQMRPISQDINEPCDQSQFSEPMQLRRHNYFNRVTRGKKIPIIYIVSSKPLRL